MNSSRRQFLKAVGLGSAGLVVGVSLSSCSGSKPWPGAPGDGFQPDAFIHIADDGHITFFLPSVEMGQGTATGFTTLIAEELEVEPADIEVRHAGVHEDYGFLQVTGGSSSMRNFFQPLRQAAANARETLRDAVVEQLGVTASEITFEDSRIHVGGKHYHYGEFVAQAATLPLREDSELKPLAQSRLIGVDGLQRVDALAKVTGQAEYSIDFEHADVVKAAILHCPVRGGTVLRDNRKQVLAMPGVIKVVDLDSGVAVVAQHYWQAKKAVQALAVEWQLPALATQTSSVIKQNLIAALDDEGAEHVSEGDVQAAIDEAEVQLSADYYVPYAAHATMEPMNCAAHINNGELTIWAGTQSPAITQAVGAYTADMALDNVHVHTPWLGGGFGRRLENDYVVETVQIAQQLEQAVHLVWSREEDMRNDFYRPVSTARISAGVNKQGELHGWSIKRAGPNVLAYSMEGILGPISPVMLPDGMREWLSNSGHNLFENWMIDFTSVEGLEGEYDVPHREVRHVTIDPGLRLGSLRSVGASFSGFFKESFIDELAQASNIDPLEFRLNNSKANPRFNAVLALLKKESGWPRATTPGAHLGVAAHFSFQTYVAQAVEASVINGQIKVHKVVCVVDCGTVVNPDIVRAQMESGIVYGLSLALYSNITLDNGAVQQSNFHDYPVLRMNECPIIEVHIVDSTEPPTGVGEPGVPPIPAAVANAVFSATGQRLRELPLRLT